MAKISPASIKYVVHATFEAEGAIEKPDIIGAIFGQTEGLLGDELEMRELQKSGKIGRIEVQVEYDNSKTRGEIEVPSALNKTETTIIAAALETIERVGPSDTTITVKDIEDVRGNKRDYILERAKKLMERFGESENEMDELAHEVQDSAKVAKMQSYGTENLPCGDISGNELIIVEGRADVVTMLKKGIKNVIAMNGSKLPPSISSLSKEKDVVILYVDGDRGGNLIIKNVVENAKIDFIAMAPEGKEVEELTGKEILQSLRMKVPVSEYMSTTKRRGVKRYDRDQAPENTTMKREGSIKKMSAEEKDLIAKDVEDLVGTKAAIIFNSDLKLLKKVPVVRLGTLRLDEAPYIIAIDGTATPKVIEHCENLGCHNLIAGNFVYADTDINLVSL